MENASKALIIAGAILLAIVIISLGLVVVNNSRNTINGANTNKQEVLTFNSAYEAYVGNKRTSSDVRALVSEVVSNNGSQTTNATYHYIAVSNTGAQVHAPAGATTAPSVSMPTGLVAGKTYTISVYYSSDGYVDGVSYKSN